MENISIYTQYFNAILRKKLYMPLFLGKVKKINVRVR